jgi:LysM repeat protein
MKLIKIFGIVAGIHAVALLLIFMNPGCSSSTAQPAPAGAQPNPAAPPADASAQEPIIAAPVALSQAEAPAPVGILFKPTRPGTPAAAALQSEPAADVTPATTYTVSRGDSLWSIAKRNHLKASELAAANGLRAGAMLHEGQKLVIPAKAPAVAREESAPAASPGPATPQRPKGGAFKHTVRPGETLGSIARKYGVKVGDLATANAISDPKMIHPGQELEIPAGGHPTKTLQGSPRGAASAPAAVPATGQDLDSGLKTPPGAEIPVIKIEPDQPASPPADAAPGGPAKFF